MKNKISPELKVWLAAERGRNAALARHLDVSRMLVTLWIKERIGISASTKKGYHAKILAFTGICATHKAV